MPNKSPLKDSIIHVITITKYVTKNVSHKHKSKIWGNSNETKRCHLSLKTQAVNTTVSSGLMNDLDTHHASKGNKPRMFTNLANSNKQHPSHNFLKTGSAATYASTYFTVTRVETT